VAFRDYLIIIGIIGFILYGITAAVIDKIKKSRIRCKHGNKTRGDIKNCSLCLDEKKQSEAKEIIKNEAIAYRSQEIKKLKKAHYNQLGFLYDIDPIEFEDIVNDLFRKNGYEVHPTPPTNDRGKDAIAYRNGRKYLIECKRYSKENRIGRPLLQKFFAAIYEEEAIKGFFVTTSFFASTAYEYATANKIELISGTKLIEMMNNAYPEVNNRTVSLMCENCGAIIEYERFADDQFTLCSCGNSIKHIEYKEMFKKPYINNRYRRY